MLMLVPSLLYGQEGKESTVKKSVSLTNHGQNAASFDFGEGEWKHIIVRMNGKYRKDLTHKPSQNFEINYGFGTEGGTIFKSDVYGDAVIERKITGTGSHKLVVSAKLIAVHGASGNASGTVEVLAFREGPGVFYVTEVTYDVKNARLLGKPELPVGTETIEENNTDEESSGTYLATYTETKTLTWEKTFEHSEKVEISIGYKAGSGGGFEAMTSLAANFKNTYKTGSTEQKSDLISRSCTYKVPPHTTKRIFAVQTKNTYEMDYTMKGYTLDEKGEKIAPFEKKSKCIFEGVQSTRILQETMNSTNGLQAGSGPEVIEEWEPTLK